MKKKDLDWTTPEKILDLKANGIPLKYVKFQTTVTSIDGTPEYVLYHGSTHRRSRNALLWWHPTCILIEQEDRYKIESHSIMADCEVL